MAGVLVLLSIGLITIYFRESSGGGLHQVQSAGATVLRPFEVAADRVSRPFRDAYGYFSGLFGAKSENKRLRAEVDRLRHETQMPVHLAESPLTCVAVGSGRSLEEFEAIHRSHSARKRNNHRPY